MFRQSAQAGCFFRYTKSLQKFQSKNVRNACILRWIPLNLVDGHIPYGSCLDAKVKIVQVNDNSRF